MGRTRRLHTKQHETDVKANKLLIIELVHLSLQELVTEILITLDYLNTIIKSEIEQYDAYVAAHALVNVTHAAQQRGSHRVYQRSTNPSVH